MAVASTLVNDPASAAMLDNLVVVIDPLLNPDGRERYIQWFTRTQGSDPNPNPDAFEHTEPWPGGRFNHYLIDMNRDWAWSSQRETRARIAQYRQWMPQVFVDFHEMFYNSTYFFPPDAKPINVNLPKDVNRWLEVFGRANAEAFTRNHWPFFVGETFDLFYPGYGDSWPSLHGAIGMTYEVAGHSRAGTSVLRDDGNVYTLADRIARHTTSGLTTLRTAAAHREDLLRYTSEAARTQLAAPETTYLLAPGAPPAFRAASYGYLGDGDEPTVYRVAGRMLRDDVKFNVSEDPIVVGDRTYARGTIVVLKGNNKTDVDTALERIGRDEMAAFVPVETGWIGGTAFGSERIHFIRDPKIALVGGNGTDSTSYGMLWHTLDVDTPIPHTTLSMDALRNTDFGHYRVIVFPSGGAYHDRLGKSGIEKLKAWINGGGTLVAIKTAGGFLREKDVEISKAKLWEPPKKKDDDKSPPAEERYNEFRVPGAAFRTKINDRSFFTFGVPRPPFVLMEGSEAVLPVSHRVDNVVTIEKDNLLAAGVAWPESLDRLKGSAYMIAERYGRGYVVTFADEPHFRLFWRGTLPLFLNTVLYAPSFPHD